MNLVQYVEFVSGAANVYDVTVAMVRTSDRGNSEVSDQGDHLSPAHLLDVSRRLKDFPLSSAPRISSQDNVRWLCITRKMSNNFRNRFSD